MTDTTSERVLLWRVGGERYGVPLPLVREILPVLPATRIPGAPAVVRGLVNLRGTILTVLDAQTLFGYEATGTAESMLVVEVADRTVGLEVDEVEDLRMGASEDWMSAEYHVPDLEQLIRPVFAAFGTR